MPTLQTFELKMIESDPKPLANPSMDQRSSGIQTADMEIDNGLNQ
jgi:hypothetical protein